MTEWAQFVVSYRADLLARTGEHMGLVLVSIAIAFGTVVSADVLSLKRFGHDVSEEFC